MRSCPCVKVCQALCQSALGGRRRGDVDMKPGNEADGRRAKLPPIVEQGPALALQARISRVAALSEATLYRRGQTLLHHVSFHCPETLLHHVSFHCPALGEATLLCRGRRGADMYAINADGETPVIRWRWRPAASASRRFVSVNAEHTWPKGVYNCIIII